MPITKGCICRSILWEQEQVRPWHLQGVKAHGHLCFKSACKRGGKIFNSHLTEVAGDLVHMIV